ncbi:LRR receptor-like serine/threonine-protein kinase ER1 [Miscanthus floridulus]|uniref:LRR receptor-like serine/threonine-protein kinase ER1 n=1 Tax=Miscanthus floridulus TaxID=154761 RepID=UPI003457B2E6
MKTEAPGKILKNNQVIGAIPSTLSQLPDLKILDFAQNNLTREIQRLIYFKEVLQYLTEYFNFYDEVCGSFDNMGLQ